jgi:hypothetical protein
VSLKVMTRRQILLGGGALALGLSCRTNAAISIMEPESEPHGTLVDRALRALELHRARFSHRDLIGIADFTQPSSIPRFYLFDVASGRSRALLVAHGRGSDPDHSGWVERFSNIPGSAASSAGAYVTGDVYYGKHGPSRRLIGLDPENSNAEARAIVIHAAPYVNPGIVHERGKLGRSEGCFAFDAADLEYVLGSLGPGQMIYADKL